MRVSELTRPKPTRAEIDLGDGDRISVVFDRNKITPATRRRAMELDSEDATMSMANLMAEFLLEWDVTAEDGSPYPPTAENISVLSFSVLGTLMNRMVEASVPSSAEGNASSDTSPSPSTGFTPTPETHPNGQVTSPSLPVSASPSPT